MKLLVLLFLFSFSVDAAEISSPWTRVIISNAQHTMVGFVPTELRAADTLNIVIEGDGKPGIGLSLARSIGGNTVYIARPCQYSFGKRYTTCDKELWTSHRYSQAVIESMNHAISVMKIRYKAKNIRLIGFSGGGTVATIVAAIRDDVSLLVTAAGNLDHKRWTDFNEIEQLNGSLNPIDYSVALENVHQIHLVGERDDIVPGSILTSYLSHMKKLDNVKSFIIQGADHYCCWSIALANILD
ncbi:hypothetical protein LCGC14_1444240 [marine sediment metagenome]|uniref:Serine hydrolase FSH domain-containing protein n=2 Tax=root TaxID=1 RepID=A0A0F9M075_9ZZZZ